MGRHHVTVYFFYDKNIVVLTYCSGSVESSGDNQLLVATLGADPSGGSLPSSGRTSVSNVLPGGDTLEPEQQKKPSSQMSTLPFILSNQVGFGISFSAEQICIAS